MLKTVALKSMTVDPCGDQETICCTTKYGPIRFAKKQGGEDSYAITLLRNDPDAFERYVNFAAESESKAQGTAVLRNAGI